MTPEEIENHLDLVGPDEVRKHAARFLWLASNCITEKMETIENGQAHSYALHLDLFYNFMVTDTVDYLMGKAGSVPAIEAHLTKWHLFGRGETPERAMRRCTSNTPTSSEPAEDAHGASGRGQ